MEKKVMLVFLLGMLQLTYSLSFFNLSAQHFQTNNQLAALKGQQSAFEKQVLNLIDDIKNVESKVNASTNTSEKVIVLENAILS